MDKAYTYSRLTKVIQHLIAGNLSGASAMLETDYNDYNPESEEFEFYRNFRRFIDQYSVSTHFLNAISEGKLDVDPPDDPFHENYMVSQCKQLHSGLLHLVWHTGQISKGDFRQKVHMLGELSLRFNEMLDSLRSRKVWEDDLMLKYDGLQKISSDKDKLLTLIAHDLRGPVSGFYGLTELMVEDGDFANAEIVRDVALKLNNSAANILKLLENLLEWSKLSQGLISFKPEKTLVYSLVNETIVLLKDMAAVKGITVVNRIDEKCFLQIDQNMAKSIFRNLIANSIKFTPKGGSIFINLQKNRDMAQVIIRDTGIGIPENILSKVFSFDGSIQRKGTEGEPTTGLGLILCREFMQRHNGEIDIHSETGKGTVVTLYFPVSQERNIYSSIA
jgi:signal transduction histidine kinase